MAKVKPRKLKFIANFSISIRKDILKTVNTIFLDKTKIEFQYKDNKVNLKKQAVLYLIYFMENVSAFYYENQVNYYKETNEFPLNSSVLTKNFNPNYQHYISFLIHYKIIEKTKNYSTGLHSNLYRFQPNFLEKKEEYTTVLISDKTLLKKINYNNSNTSKAIYEKHQVVFKDRPYLMKGFNTKLTIDEIPCRELIKTMDFNKYTANSLTLHKFINRYWEFSIKKETDNRLHTLLTRLNKKFLPFITYNNEHLAEVDIKTSQPLFLLALLNVIFKPTKKGLVHDFIHQKLGKSLIETLREEKNILDEIDSFQQILIHQDLYQYIASKIEIENDGKNFFRYEYNKGRGTKKIVKYTTKRQAVKLIVMQTLYSNPNNRDKGVKQIKTLFPTIFSVVDTIKRLHEKDNFFPTLLQQFEAYILLDIIAKNITTKYPKLILFSKHDSLITTQSNIDLVQSYAQKELRELLFLNDLTLAIDFWKTE